METRRWTNNSLPQTLGNAVILLYLNAVLDGLLGGLLFHPIGLLIVAAYVGGGYGIANERKWGYQLAVGAAVSPFILRLLVNGAGGVLATSIITLMFEVLLLALLLHPQSRDHQRIWFS